MNAPNLATTFAPRTLRSARWIAPACTALLGLAAAGCQKGHPAPITSGAEPNTILAQPDPTIGSETFVVDPNHGGQSGSVKISKVLWGRLVNVRDSSGEPQNQNFVIGEDIHTDNIDYLLETNAITEETSVTILHPANTPAFVSAFQRLDQNLTVVLDKNLNPSTLPPFTLVPRNAAMVIQFDDLMDTSTIGRETLRLVTGYPAVTPFDYRAIPDINHGDLFDADGDGVLEFHTSRAILDLTVSAIEAAETSPPPPINNLGLPASLNTSQANVGVRIPTHLDASIGQTSLLRNLAGHGLSFSGNGSNDPASSTDDIVRAVRSGGNTSVTNDQNNGFLLDEVSPKIVGVQPIQIATPTPLGGGLYLTSVDYTLDFCASKLKVGDVIQQPGVFGEVTSSPNNPSGGTVADVEFRVVFPPNGTLGAGTAQIFTTWDPVVNFGKQGCFVRFAPSNAPGGGTPGSGVKANAQVLLRFSEPMDPSTVSAFDNMPVLRVDPGISTPTARDYVIGAVTPSADLKEFKFTPVIEFKHTVGSSNDRYWLNVGSGAAGPTDLSGRPISNALPAVLFTIDPNEPTFNNGGLVFRFSSQDELLADGKPEWRGQTVTDLTSGTLSPRPVGRLHATCDRSILVPGAMVPVPTGIQTPLSGMGSKLQALWRYCDLGIGLTDESTYNVDVEHLYWSPAGGNVVADSFSLFEIRLSHTKVLPDETFDPIANAAVFPGSGLTDVFDNNLLDSTNDPQAIVHPQALGYIIDPAAKKFSATGASTVMPYPLNETIPVSQYRYYTWRDTTLLAKGAVDPNMPGAEVPINVGLSGTGIAGCPFTNIFGENPAPSVALPLLMEFRCFPDATALGLNALDVNSANPAPVSRPNFRAFSTGGSNSSGQQVHINPDLEGQAHGGFNPSSVPPGGATPGLDNTVYLGEMDLVLRISRMHSIWLDSGLNAPTYLAPVIEPSTANQPLGTSIDLDYRAATVMTPPTAGIATDANLIDAYGNPTLCPFVPTMAHPCNFTPCGLNGTTSTGIPTFLNGDGTWRNSISNITGAKLFQVRVTFVSNTDTNLSPTLSALGFAFH
jgi:hypothetical protein